MNLSTSVPVSDSKAALPVMPGTPVAAGTHGAASSADADTKAPSFSALLNDKSETHAEPSDEGAPSSSKKSSDDPTSAAAEAAGALLTGWIAAVAPANNAPPAGIDPTQAKAIGAVAEGATDLTSTAGAGKNGAAWALGSADATTTNGVAAVPGMPRPVRFTTANGTTAQAAAAAQPAAGTKSATAPAQAKGDSVAVETAAAETVASDAATTLATAAGVTTSATPASTTARIAPTSDTGSAKIAETSEKSVPLEVSGISDAIKKSLSTDKKEVTKSSDGLGIANAKQGATMTPTTNSPAQPTISAVHTSLPGPVEQATVNVTETINSPEVASQAQQAVNSIMNVVDRMSTNAPSSSVHLKFSVNGSDLAVRVEVRNGEVHATFRTDSTELRSALSSEWQTLASDTTRVPSVKEATFTSASPSSNFSASSSAGDGSFQQRESGSRQLAETSDRSSSHSYFSPSREAKEVTAPEQRSVPSVANLNLYTFA